MLELTSCAIINAPTRRSPGRSMYDQLRDLVTKISAWLIMLTCRYNAAINSSGLSFKDFTLNFSFVQPRSMYYCEENSSNQNDNKLHMSVFLRYLLRRSLYLSQPKRITPSLVPSILQAQFQFQKSPSVSNYQVVEMALLDPLKLS